MTSQSHCFQPKNRSDLSVEAKNFFNSEFRYLNIMYIIFDRVLTVKWGCAIFR